MDMKLTKLCGFFCFSDDTRIMLALCAVTEWVGECMLQACYEAICRSLE